MKSLVIPVVVFLLTIALESCGWNPKFTVENNCLKACCGNSFVTVSINTKNPQEYYVIHLRLDANGSSRICFNEIPESYIVNFNGINSNSHSIQFTEGQLIIIDNSGGDREGIPKEYLFTNGQLVEK